MKSSKDKYNTFYQQHYLFTQNNGISTLRMFLTKKVPLFEQFLKKEFDEVFDKHNMRLAKHMQQKKERSERKEKDKQDNEEEMQKKKLRKEQGIGSDSDEGEEKGFNLFKMNL